MLHKHRANHITYDAARVALSRNTFYAVGGDVFAEQAVVLVHHDLVTLACLNLELVTIEDRRSCRVSI